MINTYFKPASLREAADFLSREPGAILLSGGTYLMTPQFRDAQLHVAAIAKLLPDSLEKNGSMVSVGAGVTFQRLADSTAVPAALRAAALGMADRNIRNQATVGGNIGADKSCASLVPVFLALDARYVRFGAEPIPAGEWSSIKEPARRGIVTSVEFSLEPARKLAYGKYSRTSCDLALLSCAASAEFDAENRLRGLRIAMGGLDAHARRFPELETLFEGKALPAHEAIEAMTLPLFAPFSDQRGSSDFKRYRAALLLADVLGSLEAQS